MRMCDWGSDVCSSDLYAAYRAEAVGPVGFRAVGGVGRLACMPPAADVAPGNSRSWGSSCAIGASSRSALTGSPLTALAKIGGAACKERRCQYVEGSEVAVSLK